ncbi:MAG: phosphate/phosphite/phosphonate ABC transporter substrate-binding protein [Leptolyngbyaceae bacterium]|nr:phosphate/phosphite/phosphonate ABC transporter substrate-binding protein [Leptolyngbyaceae bacterium]
MKRRSLLQSAALFVAGFAIAACTNSEATSNRTPDTIKFAVTDVQGLEELQRDYEPFRNALTEALGKEIEFFPVADRTAAAVALQSDQVDVVLTGPAEYVVIRAKTNAVPFVALTRLNYRSVIAVQPDSGISEISELVGKKIAMSDLGSTSGQLGPTKILVDGGINPETDVEILLLGDTDLQAFKNGETDAWGGSALDYERFLEAEGLKESDFPLIEVGPALPNDVFVASSSLAPEFVEEIKQAMVENQEELVNAIISVDANQKYTGSEIIEVQDSDYDSIREAYQAIGIDDFTEFVGD